MEAAAERYLRRRGLKLVSRNYRARRGEIDLVMRHGAELVFVEVRQRRRPEYGSAAATVGPAKQRRLLAAASEYLQRNGDQPCRFDVVAFEGDTEPHWIRDAFSAGD
jgi:putative endonuclease